MSETATAMGAVGGLLGTYGSIAQGNAADTAGKLNAVQATQNASLATEQGQQQQAMLRVQTRKALGSIKAGYGASGITSDGSAMDVMMESAASAEKDIWMTGRNASIRATQYKNEAAMDIYRGKTGQTNSQMGAAANLLKTGADLYSKGSSGSRISSYGGTDVTSNWGMDISGGSN